MLVLVGSSMLLRRCNRSMCMVCLQEAMGLQSDLLKGAGSSMATCMSLAASSQIERAGASLLKSGHLLATLHPCERPYLLHIA